MRIDDEQDEERDAAWGDCAASTELTFLFAYMKGTATRVYDLRVLGDGSAEVWVDEQDGAMGGADRQTFPSRDDCLTFLADEEDGLIAEGWRPMVVH